MNRLDRISAILVQLQSRPVLRAREMAERFGVSLRTIYRDMRTLEEAGVPLCGDAGAGYSLVEGYRLPPLMFTDQEALAFLTAEKFMEQLTDTHNSRHFGRGMDKIRAVMRRTERNELAELDDSIAVYRSRRTPGEKFPNLLQTILGSVREALILEMAYTDGEGAISRREVEAVGVTFSNPFWYLTAWCHLRGGYRTFRLDRIEGLAVTDRAHTVAEHPPLESLVGRDDCAALSRVVIRTDAATARRNRDTNYFMGLTEEHELDDGRVEQVYMSYNPEAMARWVLGHGDTTTLVEPLSLNGHIEKIIEAWKRNSSR